MKRYGRNQKRKHRERIAELEGQVSQLILWERAKSREREDIEARLRDQEAHVREIVDTINSLLDYSALTTPQQVDFLRAEDNPTRIKLMPRRKFTPKEWTADPLDALGDIEIGILEIRLHDLRVIIEDNQRTFERFVHVLVPGPEELVYKVSMEAYQRGLPEVKHEIASQIMGALWRRDYPDLAGKERSQR